MKTLQMVRATPENDAGFGPGTKPSDVANYIYYRLLERQGRAPPPQPTAHGTLDATIAGVKE